MPELVLTDTERRTLANLSIPRPIPNLYHELRVDPYTMEPESEKDLLKLLESLADEGWAMKLGEFEDSAKLAHAMQDEKAKLFSERLKVRGEEWRLKGEQWVLTQAGLEKMHQPVDERPRLTTGELRSLITEQAQYVRHNTDDYHFQGSVFDQREDHGPLAGGVLLDKKTGEPFEGDAGPTLLGVAGHWQGREDRPLPWLLPEEYLNWCKLVIEDHEGAWGKGEADELRKAVPNMGGVGWTTNYSNTIIDAENQKGTITAAAPWYMALSILAFTDADTGTTADDGTHKPTYTGYARKSVAAADMNAAASGSANNLNAIIFAACSAGSSAIVAFGNCDALTLSLLRKYGTCASTTVSTTQTPAQFAGAAYTTTAD
jgi:hypothetical protein